MVQSKHDLGLGLPRHDPSAASRERLLHALDEATNAALTIVRGPGGSGKTTLLANWASSRNPQYAWVSLAELVVSDDPPTAGQLAAWLLAGLARASGTHELAGYDQAAAAVADGTDLRYALAAAAWSPPRLLVLDDLHLVPHWTAHQVLMEFINTLPQLRIVASTRVLVPLERDRALLAVDTAVIGPDELALTKDECAAVLAGTPLAPHCRTVWKVSSGSVRWVRYLAIRAADTSGPFPRIDAFIQDAAAAARGLLVPSSLPNTRRDFLLAAAVPETVPTRLAVELCPGAPSEDLLQWAEHEGLVTRRRDAEFAVVPLLRQSLLTTMERTAPHRRYELELACANFFLRAERPVEALRHAVGADSPALVASVLRRHATELIQRHPSASRRELERIPALQLVQHPAPALFLGVLLYIGGPRHRTRAVELLAAAVNSTRRLRRSTPSLAGAERFLLSGMETLALRLSGGLRKAARRAREGLLTYEQMPLAERLRIGPMEASGLAQMGISLWRAGSWEEAEAAFRLSRAAAGTEPGPEGEWHESLQACIRAARGDTVGAQECLAGHRFGGREERTGRHPIRLYDETPARLAYARLALEGLDSESARRALRPLLDGTDTSEFWAHIRCCEAMADLLDGRAVDALSRLQGLASRRRDLPALGRHEHLLLARMKSLLLLALGRPAKALDALGDAPASEPFSALMAARIHLACAQPEETLSILAGLDEANQLPALRAAAAGLAAAARLRLEPEAVVSHEVAALSALVREFGLGLSTAILPAPDLVRLRAAASAAGLPVGVPDAFDGVIPGCRPLALLTPREGVILRALAAGGSIAEIAARNYVSVNTVKSQLRSLYRKLEVSSREAALAEATVRGLL